MHVDLVAQPDLELELGQLPALELGQRDLRRPLDRDRPSAAAQQVEHILTAVEGLVSFPNSGRPGRRKGTRELVVGRTPYLVAYRSSDAIQVLRVLHGRQRWPSVL